MSNSWGVSLKKTWLNEKRSAEEQRQSSIKVLASENTSKINEYGERQGSLASDAMAGQQGRLPLDKVEKKSPEKIKSIVVDIKNIEKLETLESIIRDIN